MIIGGRVLRDERITIPKVFNKLNLKNVKNPGPGPLLFHGSIDKFSKFKAGDKISQQEYDNNKEYGLTIR
jgi:hypothetical protein